MRSIFVLSSCLLASVSASDLWARDIAPRQSSSQGPLGFLGPGSFGGFLTDQQEKDSKQLFESAGRSPSSTNSVSFDFASNSLDGNSTWTWRLNITDIAVPDGIFDTPGMHVVNSQRELQWLGGDDHRPRANSSKAGNSTSRDMCISAAEIVAPSNITRRYSEFGDCSAVLGNKCYSKFLARVMATSCAVAPNFLASDIEECKDTLIRESGTQSLSTSFGNTSDFVSTEPGNVVYYDTSEPVPVTNVSDIYDQVESRLDILLLRTNTGSSAAMVCQIVNKGASSGGRLRIDRSLILVALTISSALALL